MIMMRKEVKHKRKLKKLIIDNHEIHGPSNMPIRNSVGEEYISQEVEIDSHNIPGPSVEILRNNDDNNEQGSHTQVEAEDTDNHEVNNI